MESTVGLKLEPILFKGFPPKILPNALEGIVDSTALRSVNPLERNRDYARVGASSCFAAEPRALHFAGFEVGQVLRQRLRLVNKAGFSGRLHVLPAQSRHFRITVTDKKGHLAPGMCEEVEVQFAPSEYRYYYETVRVHCGEETFMVPVHAYPIAAKATFPRHIDFGLVPLGERATRVVPLACNVPVEFEFSIANADPDADFTVHPPSGVVPANGCVNVEVSFQPSAMCTHMTDLVLTLAQFESSPMACHVTGHTRSGCTRDSELAKLVGGAVDDMATLDGAVLVNDALKHALHRTALGGSGHGDLVTEAAWRARKSSSLPLELKLPALPRKAEDRLWPGTTVWLPADLTSHASMAYIMNQEAGRLRVRDIKTAIEEKKASLFHVSEGLRRVAAESASINALDDEEVENDVKEALFRMRLAECKAQQSTVDASFLISVGCELPSTDLQRQYSLAVSANRQSARVRRELEACRRQRTVALPDGALHLKSAPEPSGPRDAASTPAVVDAGDASTQAYPGVPSTFRPTWSDAQHDALDKRAVALARFVAAARRVVVRNRAAARLRRIQNLLRQLNWDREAVRAEVATPRLLSLDKMGARPGVEPTRHMNPDNVRTWPFPRQGLAHLGAPEPVDDSTYADYDELEPAPLAVPMAFETKGYRPQEHWGFVGYMPQLLAQPLESGAVEELAGPGVIADVPRGADGAVFATAGLAIPDAARRAPVEIVEIGAKWARTQDAVVRAPLPVWGMDAGCEIQPAVLPHYASAARENVASNAVRAVAAAQLLAERWAPRRQPWALEEEAEPRPMTGPDPDDTFELQWIDEENPEVVLPIPTEADINAWLPPTDDAELTARAETAALAAAAAPAKGKGKETVATARKEDPAVNAPERSPGPQKCDLLRMAKLGEVEDAMRSQRNEFRSAYDERVMALNAATSHPCYFNIPLGTTSEQEGVAEQQRLRSLER